MRRKLIQLAGKTLVVSLPSPWIKKYSLQKGEEIDLVEKGRSLVLGAVKPSQGSSITIDVSGLNASLIWHSVVSRYVLGFREIEVTFKDGMVLDPRTGSNILAQEAVERALECMIGMEMFRITKNSITFREIAPMAPEEYEAIVRKAWLTVVSMAEEAGAALVQNDLNAFKRSLRVEKNLNRLYLSSLRMLHAGIAPDCSSALIDARMMQSLEIMGDALASIEPVVLSGKNLPVVIKQLKAVAVLVRHSYECWYHFSNEGFGKVYAGLMAVRAFRSSDISFVVSASESIVESLAFRAPRE